MRVRCLQQPLLRLLNNYDAFSWPWHSTGNADYAKLLVNQNNLEVLYGDLLVAHLTSHLLALEDLLRVHRANRTRAAVTAATVSFAAAVEVPALNGSCPTFTLADTGYVNRVTN